MQKRLLTCFLALFVCAGSVVYPTEGNVRVRAQEKYGADLETETLERADSNTQVLYQEWEYCILEDGTAELTGYTGGEEIVSIPAKVVGADGSEVAVTQMGSVFSGNEIVKEAVIPEGIKTLGGYAFSGCSNLERVTLPDSLLRISREGFKNCAKLNGITLPGSLTYIGIQAFEGCSSLTDIVFPESLIRIEEGAFSSCNNIKHIEIPQSVESLHGSFGTAFSSKNLESIHVSEENPNYSSEDGILYDKNKTTLIKCPEQKSEVMIPQSIVAIHDSAFSGCKKLQKIDLPSSLKQIDSWVFSGCSNLQGMILPDGITEVQYHAFDGCTSMKFIAISNSVTFIDNRAFANGYDAEYNERYLDVVIICMKDSDAESYAKEYGFRYKIVDSFDGLVVGEYEEEVPGGDENKNPPVTEDKNPPATVEEQDQEKEKNLTLDKSAIQFDTIGASQTLTAIVTPADKSPQITWSTSNEKAATVKDGVVTATGNGTALITAALEDKTATAEVTVRQKCSKISITLNGQKVSGTLKAKTNKAYNFKAVISPTNADKKNAKVTWVTSDRKIAAVKDGKVSVKKKGTVTITAKTADGKTTKVKLKAGKQKVKVSKVKIAGNKTMKVRGKQTLNLTVIPATADNAKVTWSSSNKKIASVDNRGKVTAKKKGSVNITAKAKDGSGKKAALKINVK